jgi:hypothetical protein
MLKKQCLIVVFTLICIHTYSQFFESGQDPGYIRWRQIITDHTKIIYPSEYEKNALRFANILEQARGPVSSSLEVQTKRIPVILHTQSVESNGFVVLAPRRMEIYTLPPQDIYSQDWLDQLGLHEFRHVVQMDKLNHGWTKILSIFAGQQITGAVAGLTPRWFLEGDAVHSETSYSSSGRGRLPSFEMELRTLTLNKGKLFNYDKMLNGSYKDYVPDYYQYGYKMVAYGRLKFGNDLWDKVLDYTGSHPFRMVPFTLGLMKYSGRNKAELQKEAFSYYDSIWHDQDNRILLSEDLQINKRSSGIYANYRYPQFLNDSTYIVLKTGIDKLSEIIRVDQSGNEKILLKTGPLDLVRLSVIDEILVWAEIRVDPRWDNRSYSIIRTLNLKTGKSKTLTHKTRYYAPSLSPDRKKIVAVSMSTTGECSLVLLNSENGGIITSLPGPVSGALLIQPCWIDNSNVALIHLNKETKSIQKVNLNNNTYSEVFDAGSNDISDLSAGNGVLFFRGSFSGIDNLYSITLSTNRVFQVSSSRFGAYNPSISSDSKQIIYSDYSCSGFNLVRKSIDTSVWIPIEIVKNIFNSTYNSVSKTENSQEWSLKQQDTLYPSKPYRKALNLFNFHSWLPFYYDYSQINLNNPTIYPGVTAISQNLLGTALSSLGYYHASRNNYFQANFTYKGWYPVLDFHLVYGGLPSYNSFETDSIPKRTHDFIQTSLQVYLPLLYTINSHYLQVYPSIYLIHDNEYLYSRINKIYTRGKTYLQFDLLAYQFLRLSQRDFAPRFGQILDLKYGSVPWNKEWFGSIYDLSLTLFFPGLMNHHSVKLQGAFEKQLLAVNQYYLDNQITLPTGLTDLYVAEQITYGSASYSLPLFYPDLHLGPFFYLKRLRGRAFFDYANIMNASFYGQSGFTSRVATSTGAELLGDFHLLRFFYPFEGGFRVYNLNETGQNIINYQVVFKLNLGGL